MSERRGGILQVSHELLLKSLGLPEDCMVIGARVPFTYSDVLELKILHKDMPVQREGMPWRVVNIVEAEEEFGGWNFGKDEPKGDVPIETLIGNRIAVPEDEQRHISRVLSQWTRGAMPSNGTPISAQPNGEPAIQAPPQGDGEAVPLSNG